MCNAWCNICILGYVSRRKHVNLPWSKICEDPSSWIEPECVPDGFQWADPSKIRIGEIYRLLEHWRGRQQQRLTPLIWVTSCPLLTNTSPSLEDRQDYHTDNSTESGSLAQDRLENNSPDPLQSSDPSRSDHVLYSDIDLSNAHFSDNFRPSEESDDPLPAQSSSPDVNPSNEWGGFDNDSKMSSPPPHQDHSPQEDSGTFDQSWLCQT